MFYNIRKKQEDIFFNPKNIVTYTKNLLRNANYTCSFHSSLKHFSISIISKLKIFNLIFCTY